MNTYYILSYVTGALIILIALFSFAFPSRKLTLTLKASIDAVAILNLVFIMLATNNNLLLAGIVTTSIGLCRDIVFYFRNKTKCLNHIAWPISFSCIFLLSLIFTYKSPISLLVAVGSVFSTMTLFANDQKITKIGAIICTGLYTIYYGILIPGSDILTIFSLISSAAGFTGALVGLIILITKEKKNKKVECNNE